MNTTLVRLKHPSSGRIINVIVTHLQADYAGEPAYDGVRWDQIRQIRGQCETGIPIPPSADPPLIPKTLGPSLPPLHGLCRWPNDQWLLLMGDLNIRGEGAIGDAVYPAVSPNPAPTEWWYKIGHLAANADDNGLALYDAWAETTSEPDHGITHRGETAAGDERLDYILVSRRTNGDPPFKGTDRDLAVQHIWIPPELEGVSDHLGVAADINLGAPQCNPRLAVAPTPEDMGSLGLTGDKEARKFHQVITFPGSMQWWRLDESGTYSIALDPVAKSQGLAFELYQGKDLSHPLSGSYDLGDDTISACELADEKGKFDLENCRQVDAKKFVLPEGPIYVRVFSTDRSWTGNYWIAFHRFSCRSKEDACFLLPHAVETFAFPPGGTPLNQDDTAWFELAVAEQADSGQPQTLQFFCESNQGSGWIEPKLYLQDGTGTGELTEIDGQALTGPTSTVAPSGAPIVLLDGTTATNGTFFLRLKRLDLKENLSVRLGWRTNLTLLGGSSVGPDSSILVCMDETDPELGEDDIELQVNVDGQGWTARGSASFDCDEATYPRNWNSKLGVIRFLNSVEIRLVEGDVGPDDISPSKAVDLIPFDAEVKAPWRHSIKYSWEDGEYVFHFNTGKWTVQ